MSDTFKRYMVPGGHGVEAHDAGLLYLRTDVDPMIAQLRARIEALEPAQYLYDQSAEFEMLKKRVNTAEAGNELDRSRVAIALTKLHGAIRSRDWVLEGRGPYEWDDDDYRAEFALWVDDVTEAARLFSRIATDWHGCPIERTAIRHARAALKGNSDE